MIIEEYLKRNRNDNWDDEECWDDEEFLKVEEELRSNRILLMKEIACAIVFVTMNMLM